MTLFLSFSPHFQGFLSSTLFHLNFKGQKFQNPNSKKSSTLKNSKKLNLKYQGWFFQIPTRRKSSKPLQKSLKKISKQLFSWVLWILNSRICTWRTWVTCNESTMHHRASPNSKNNYHTFKAVNTMLFHIVAHFKSLSISNLFYSLFQWIINNDSFFNLLIHFST